MREIKFRAWNRLIERMVGVGAIDWNDGKVISIN